MTPKDIIYEINKVGALCKIEVCGIQHQFKLNISDLSPASAIYRPNKAHIRNTAYTLVPDVEASQIQRIGRDVFKQLEKKTDYIDTYLGKFIALESLEKFIQVLDKTEKQMREKATALFKNTYQDYYQRVFRTAYNFFKGKNKEFRSQLKMFDNNKELNWKEVETIYRELQQMENDIRAINKKRKLKIHDLDSPERKAAFTLRKIPLTFDKYLTQLCVNVQYFTFHPMTFERIKYPSAKYECQSLSDLQELLEYNRMKP